jgi:hypothetical protein
MMNLDEINGAYEGGAGSPWDVRRQKEKPGAPCEAPGLDDDELREENPHSEASN